MLLYSGSILSQKYILIIFISVTFMVWSVILSCLPTWPQNSTMLLVKSWLFNCACYRQYSWLSSNSLVSIPRIYSSLILSSSLKLILSATLFKKLVNRKRILFWSSRFRLASERLIYSIKNLSIFSSSTYLFFMSSSFFCIFSWAVRAPFISLSLLSSSMSYLFCWIRLSWSCWR